MKKDTSTEIDCGGFSGLMILSGDSHSVHEVHPTKRFIDLNPGGMVLESDSGLGGTFSIVPGQRLFPGIPDPAHTNDELSELITG